MKRKPTIENRRNFLKTLVPASTLMCIGCPGMMANDILETRSQGKDFNQKIQTKIDMTYEKLFEQRYNFYINKMKRLAEYVGEEKLNEMLERASDDNNRAKSPNTEATSVRDFIDPILKSEWYNNTLDLEVVEYTDHICEMKTTNCIRARIFLERNLGNLGYASICHGDFSGATAFNPKLRLERTKTLMQGHDCCNHRYIWEG